MSLNPLDNPSAWDHALFDGDPTPGLCIEVAGVTNPRKWDEKAGSASSGATLVYGGDGLAKFPIKLQFWLPEHFAAWDEFKVKLKPPSEKNPKAIDFWHPQTELLPVPVNAVVVDEPGSPQPTGDGTIFVVEIKLRQHRPSKPAGAKTSGTGGGGGYTKGGDSVDSLINDLKKTVEDMGK